MAYQATAIQVMIASPGNVSDERDSIRKNIHDWNDLNAAKEKVILLPVGWDTHSASDLSGRAQEQINGRLLKHCDLLVGVFWTRLGTPTGEHASDTVEEIKRHVDSGKTAMVYFSTRTVVPGSYDQKQFKGVLEFKEWCQAKGIVGTFGSVEEFDGKFRNELQIILRDNPYINSLTKSAEKIQSIVDLQLSIVELTDLAVDMLKNAAQSKDGMITTYSLLSGMSFSAGEKRYSVERSHRETARLQAAVEELQGRRLIKDIGYKGEMFRLTYEGYEEVERRKVQS